MRFFGDVGDIVGCERGREGRGLDAHVFGEWMGGVPLDIWGVVMFVGGCK